MSSGVSSTADLQDQKKVCAKCATAPAPCTTLKTCGKCRSAWYCSRERQRADQREHKKVCASPADNLMHSQADGIENILFDYGFGGVFSVVQADCFKRLGRTPIAPCIAGSGYRTSCRQISPPSNGAGKKKIAAVVPQPDDNAAHAQCPARQPQRSSAPPAARRPHLAHRSKDAPNAALSNTARRNARAPTGSLTNQSVSRPQPIPRPPRPKGEGFKRHGTGVLVCELSCPAKEYISLKDMNHPVHLRLRTTYVPASEFAALESHWSLPLGALASKAEQFGQGLIGPGTVLPPGQVFKIIVVCPFDNAENYQAFLMVNWLAPEDPMRHLVPTVSLADWDWEVTPERDINNADVFHKLSIQRALREERRAKCAKPSDVEAPLVPPLVVHINVLRSLGGASTAISHIAFSVPVKWILKGLSAWGWGLGSHPGYPPKNPKKVLSGRVSFGADGSSKAAAGAVGRAHDTDG
ncbi:hypothetical protein BDK51DRAFT_43978 [Blyttiomyces helicus]|uniref:MYND-type domain-containing protein n=1 Tax=Blyttiomyces helicus TaxID=388810 RepID=A0A4P9WEA3_9FUNG|nr:hypothetical protein BDK51DRAFT_43978 [Blyttiomyces helicus]|eukprot:RKO91049.1 hypothetical protein BDK51DRAFT_43978 [Blyttiomyces helicus]